MKQQTRITIAAIFALLPALAGGGPLQAQVVFDLGSTGADGPLVVDTNTTLQVPPDGIFHFTTIEVQSGRALFFTKNALNTPIYMLATGDVTIAGTINVTGGQSTSTRGGLGGPGGFDGGAPGFSGGEIPPGAGHGPGGGLGDPTNSGGGSYGGLGTQGSGGKAGQLYGNPTLIPLLGGSGGGAENGSGGGGGGGAILIASNSRIDFTGGLVDARGGSGVGARGGSGGAIRLVAPIVGGTGSLRADVFDGGGNGRIRIDSIDRSQFNISVFGSTTFGTFVKVFPDTPLPRLDLAEVAGQIIAEGTPQPVVIDLPVGSPTSHTITVQGRNFTGLVNADIVLIPDSGDPTTIPVQLDFTTANPVQTTVTVDFPVNNRTSVFAWVR